MKTEAIFDLFENEQIGFLVNSEKSVKGDLRLDSSHFMDESDIVLSDKIKFTTLSDFIEDIEEPTLFTRIYCDEEFGVPYISSSEMSEIEPPVKDRFISKNLTKNINQYIIKRGQILVSAAGTVGSIVVATAELNGVAGTSDILRINVDKEKDLGFVYTYLTSSFGASELANLAYGAIIKRVRGFQVAKLKTPIINSIDKMEMNELVLKALNSRDNANIKIQRARSLVLQYNNLPLLSQSEPRFIDPLNEVEIRLVSNDEFTHDYRLDSHYYSIKYKDANDAIREQAVEYISLKDLTSNIFMGNRFTRNFVNSNNGIQFIGTRNTLQIRPSELKYLSKTETQNISELILNKNWILLARSGSLGGTFGRVSFVWNNFEGYCGSEHIIRVCPNDNKIDSAYLYAFLSCQYGYLLITQLRHGALIDEIDPDDLSEIPIPIPSKTQQKEIGDLVRQAYNLRAEAIRFENKAQEILTNALTNV